MGLAEFVCDELHWAVRETLRCAGEEELTLLGWCIGGTLCAMYCALHPAGAVRNAVLLTTPIDPSGSLYARWVGNDDFDVDLIADSYAAIPGAGIDWANKLMKPVTNYVTTYRRLFQNILRRPRSAGELPGDGEMGGRQPAVPRPRLPRVDHLDVQGEPPGRRASARCAGERVDLAGSSRTSSSSPPAPTTSRRRGGTVPLLDLVASEDVTHLDRPGGHIGLMAGSKAKHEIWPELADWLGERSGR